MGKLMKTLAKRGKNAARKTYRKAKTEILAASARRSLRRKVKTVKQVGKKAAKQALAAAAVAAASVVVQEVRRRRRPA